MPRHQTRGCNMPTSNSDVVAGIKIATLIPGFIGAALSLSYAKELTRTQAAGAVALGCAVAVYGAPLAMQWLGTGWPDSLERCVAFFLGLFAMPLVPALRDAASKIKLPWTKD